MHYRVIIVNVSISFTAIKQRVMAIGSASVSSSRVSTKTGKRTTNIVDQLRRDIVLGLLAPRETLLELDLAARFSCSQSTIREALLALNEEGLVVRFAHRGTLVADCLRDDMIELVRLRHDIECRGVERVIERYDRLMYRALTELVEQMIDAARADDEYRLAQLDRQFHLRIFEEANLPSVIPILQRCLINNHRFKILNSERSAPLTVTAERHWPIVAALDSGNLPQAVDALSLHITTIVDLGPSILPRITSPTGTGHA